MLLRSKLINYQVTATGFEPTISLPVWSKEFLDIQATVECKFTLKRVRDMKITYIEAATRGVL